MSENCDERDIKKKLEEKVLEKETVYGGRVIDVERWRVSMPDGRLATREIIRHPGAAAVVPLDADGSATMVYQYRHPLGRVTLEIPAGKRDPGEDPLTCAQRELREEVGLEAESWTLLTELATSPGVFDERIWLYLATGLSRCPTHPDEDEFLGVRRFPLDMLIERIVRGDIQDSKTIAALMLAREALGR